MKNQCILHFGIPKTGTSSIQESLYLGLKDPRFHYCDLGSSNGSRGLTSLFGNSPSEKHFNRIYDLGDRKFAKYQKDIDRLFEKSISHASSHGKTLIISAESAWIMNAEELLRIRRYMEDRSFSVKTITYLRPLKQWLESIFQQRVKGGRADFHDIQNGIFHLKFRDRIQVMEDVFGMENVEIIKYDKRNLKEGCAVKDFCHRLGIHFDPDDVRRVNESLSLPAIKFLYTYYKMGPGYGKGNLAIMSNNLLSYTIMPRLEGPPLHFHSSAVRSVIDEVASQRPWLEERLGIPFDEDILESDGTDCIREEADFFKYDRESLEWLAMKTGRRIADNPTEVAECIHRLRMKPNNKDIWKGVSMIVEKRTRRLNIRLQNNLRTSTNWKHIPNGPIANSKA
jgi:hypothetical protein